MKRQPSTTVGLLAAADAMLRRIDEALTPLLDRVFPPDQCVELSAEQLKKLARPNWRSPIRWQDCPDPESCPACWESWGLCEQFVDGDWVAPQVARLNSRTTEYDWVHVTLLLFGGRSDSGPGQNGRSWVEVVDL